MKVLLFGARGFMGKHFRSLYQDAIDANADIADPAAVARALDAEKPDVVINAAGKAGHPNVDWCEDHKMETVRSNVAGPLVLLEECAKRSLYWVHMSSGCIYTGDNGGRGFTEEDAPNYAGSFYSRTKAWSDQILKEFPVLQLRLRMPFDASDDPRNLIVKLKKYTKVLDEPNSLTHLPDFLTAAKLLIERRKTGIFNIVNPGVISPFEIMQRYKNIVDPAHVFERLDVQGLSSVVKAGRSNCFLSGEKLAAEGIRLPDVHTAIEAALSARSIPS